MSVVSVEFFECPVVLVGLDRRLEVAGDLIDGPGELVEANAGLDESSVECCGRFPVGSWRSDDPGSEIDGSPQCQCFE